MAIYKTKYLAQQNRKSGGDRIIKVYGGYTVMSARQYQVWRNQK